MGTNLYQTTTITGISALTCHLVTDVLLKASKPIKHKSLQLQQIRKKERKNTNQRQQKRVLKRDCITCVPTCCHANK
jgi:CO dehydrogenase/acetyl-CoA synthase delta subunit